MTFDVTVTFEGGCSRRSKTFQDLGAAAGHTFEIADCLGRPLQEIDGYGFPKTVEISRQNELLLSVAILPGGLLPANNIG